MTNKSLSRVEGPRAAYRFGALIKNKSLSGVEGRGEEKRCVDNKKIAELSRVALRSDERSGAVLRIGAGR